MVNLGFWEKMKPKNGGPILSLAPMADVTDAAFRYIIAKYSKLHHTSKVTSQGEPLAYITWTEFVSADGLALAPEEGRKKLLKDLEYDEIERPIVAQFFTGKPENMEKAAVLARELGFDGIDINMGCPDRSIEKQKAGAALIKNPKLAQEIVLAAKQGAKDLPVSVKTRLGYNEDQLDEWLLNLLETEPAVITIHARTRKEMSKVPARWERIKGAVGIRNSFTPQPQKCTDIFLLKNSSCSLQSSSQGISEVVAPRNSQKTLIFGNGDTDSIEDAYKKAGEAGCDGVMLGRAIFGNPWLFSGCTPSEKERLEVLAEHAKLFEEKFGPSKNWPRGLKSFAIMKKHFKSYLSGIPNSKEILEKMMKAENASDVQKIVDSDRVVL